MRMYRCYYCGRYIDEDGGEALAWTEGKPRHARHEGCTHKLNRHERDLLSDNWHTRTQAQYADLTTEELQYVLRDARQAAEAGRGLSSEGKYLDQQHYALGELRKRGVTPWPRREYGFRFMRYDRKVGTAIGAIRTVPGDQFIAGVTAGGVLVMEPRAMSSLDINQADLNQWWAGMKRTLGLGAPLQLPAPRKEAYYERMRRRVEARGRQARLTR